MSEIKEGNLAEIKDLSVSFMTDAGSIKAIDKISFEIPRKKVIGVVGESGSGKSVTARSLIKLLPETATTSGAVYLSNRAGAEELEVLSLSGEQLREMRGAEAAMVFQEPNSVLNPVYTIGWQIEEGLRAHGMKDKKERRAKAIDILKKVGIPEAETRIDYYPHQFSGGQKQRIVIAMALVLNPGLILADEPTTALDVTVQAEILDLLRLARDEFDASVLIITHNMGVIADIADQVVVMYRGHVVEQGDVESIFYHPSHPYTQRLLAAVPRIGQKLVVRDVDGKPIDRTSDWHDEPLAVEAKGLTITYPGHLMQPDFVAVDGIDFAIHRSEVLGLVGESGSGKSTTGRAIAGLQKVSGGSLNVLGVEMNGVRERDFKPKRADIGFVFQDPGSSFNPLMTIAENVAEPLIVHRKYSSVADAKEYVGDLLEMVQLPRAYMSRFPHELSGGQRQRASLARALALKPSLLIADEPTSALDVLPVQEAAGGDRFRLPVHHPRSGRGGHARRPYHGHAQGTHRRARRRRRHHAAAEQPVHEETARLAAGSRPARTAEAPRPPARAPGRRKRGLAASPSRITGSAPLAGGHISTPRERRMGGRGATSIGKELSVGFRTAQVFEQYEGASHDERSHHREGQGIRGPRGGERPRRGSGDERPCEQPFAASQFQRLH